MRLINLYQVYDTRAQTTLGPIFTAINEVSVARELRDHANNKETLIGKTPEDFVLLQIGVQDQDTGQIDPMERTTVVLKCTELVTPQQPQNQNITIAS